MAALAASLGFNATGLVAQLREAHEEVVAAVLGPMQTAWAAPGVASALRQFVAAVDWSEPAILCAGCLHLALYAAAYFHFSREPTRTALFLLALLAAGFAAQPLNDLGARHHKLVFRSGTNYFDAHGIFITAVFGAPLLLLAFLLQLRLFAQAGSLMIRLQRAKLRARRHEQAAADVKKQQ